jgi:antibiotic biosynthesis monooxygenase (ABM) superfamily enzyme
MLGIHLIMADGSTRTDSAFRFLTLEALVAWSKSPERQASWRLMGVSAVVPVDVEG